MKKDNPMKEVLSLVFEFIISMTVLLGGGLFLYFGDGAANEFIIGIMTMVAIFWFQNRKADKDNIVNRENTTQAIKEAVNETAPLVPIEDVVKVVESKKDKE